MRTSSRLVIAASATIALALAGCGADAPSTSEPLGDPFEFPAEPDIAAACAPDVPDCSDTVDGGGGDRLMSADITLLGSVPEGTRVVEMAPGASANADPLFVSAAVVGDGNLVTLLFTGGEAPCFFIDHVEIVEVDDAVTVTVLAGGELDGICDGQSSEQGVAVELAAPLGTRGLVDGSRIAPEGAMS